MHPTTHFRDNHDRSPGGETLRKGADARPRAAGGEGSRGGGHPTFRAPKKMFAAAWKSFRPPTETSTHGGAHSLHEITQLRNSSLIASHFIRPSASFVAGTPIQSHRNSASPRCEWERIPASGQRHALCGIKLSLPQAVMDAHIPDEIKDAANGTASLVFNIGGRDRIAKPVQ
jgi:hypothetical protein